MKRRASCILAVYLLLWTCPVTAQEPLSTRPAVETLEEYFDLLASGNLESAQGLWTQEALERSGRFGITYTDIPLKVDAGSPVVRDLNTMRNFLFPAVSQVTVLAGGDYVRMDYKKVVNGREVEHPYYAYYDGKYYWLTYPQDYVAGEWPVLETKYYRLHQEPGVEVYLNPVLLEQADLFVERAADSLGLTKADREELAARKIEFFFCKTDSTVYRITGHLTKGTTDLASNDIISSYFPHNHELIHLLVNIKLKTLPLYTQPILREGIAVHYGGRWGKAPTSLVFLGAFLQDNKIVEVDSIISMERFETQAGADMAYPVAGLFCGFLLERMGQEAFFDLYRRLSGRFEEVGAMLAPTVKRTVFEAAKAPSWEALIGDFAAFNRILQNERAVFAPGSLKKGKTRFADAAVEVKADKRWVSLVFLPNGDDELTGNLLFGYDQRLEGARSMLFDEQYQHEISYPGYRWGIRFDGNEAGLYDYATNQLVGKYIYGITPSEDYRGADGKAIAVRYLLDLADGAIPTETDHKLLKN